MPARKRTGKVRTGQLTAPERIDLVAFGPLGSYGDDRRVGRLWDDEDQRRDAYLANRDSLLAHFRAGGSHPPRAADDYETEPEFHLAAVRWYLAEARHDLARNPGSTDAARRVVELSAMLEDPDAGRARQASRRRVPSL